MPDEDELLPEDLEDESTDEVEDSDETEGQADDKFALFEQRIAGLEATNAKLVSDFSASVGRVQSLITRLESGRGEDTERLQKQVNSAVSTVESQLDVILASEMVDPEIRARAQQARDRMRAEADVASLRDEVTQLRNRPPVIIPPVTNELSPTEQNVHAMIFEAGMKLEDFDWEEARGVVSRRGEPGVYSYFTNKIAEHKAEQAATERRQARKTSAGKGAPAAAGTSGDIASRLEASVDGGNLDDGVALLRSLGVNI